MALHKDPRENFHKSLENLLTEWARTPRVTEVLLSYGTKPAPWAHITHRDTTSVVIPLPRNFAPYNDWKDFFTHYLESQVALLAHEQGLTTLVKTSSGQWVLVPATQPVYDTD